MMKVFISQPMNGKSDEEILKRRKEIQDYCIKTFQKPCDFIDSFSKKDDTIRKGRIAMLGDSISLMCDAELVVFDKGWEKTHGCRVERMVCAEYSIPVYDMGNPIARMHKIRTEDEVVFWR